MSTVGILRQLRVDHRSNQFLDIALGFSLAFGEFVQPTLFDFET